ncbi:MAG: signal peptidase II [Gammaproteobacteria bacterium]|nr:signal peptidase II [Gammaproteobacteria bacterium]
MESVFSAKKSGLHWLWLSLIVIVADQLVKYLIRTHLLYNESVNVFPFFNLTLAHNKGAAFSFLSEGGYWAPLLFIVTALIISTVLCIWMYRLPPKNYWLGIGLALILGGAIGNLIDRLIFGYVIDFVHLHVANWSFPIFNIADVGITVGALMLIIDIFKKKSP